MGQKRLTDEQDKKTIALKQEQPAGRKEKITQSEDVKRRSAFWPHTYVSEYTAKDERFWIYG